MSYDLFIDDERHPPHADDRKWTIVRSYEEAVNHMEKHGCPRYISFDHDLGDGPTGYDVAKWIVNKAQDDENFFPKYFGYYVHSQNPIGAKNIINLMNSWIDRN